MEPTASLQLVSFREMIRRNNWVVLDTETTGLRWPAEIVSIAVIDWTGETLIDSLVRPVKPIPPDASRIHGITDKDVAHAPLWRDVRRGLVEAITGHDLVIYNAQYDLQLLEWTDTLQGIKEPSPWLLDGAYCAMNAYSEFRGEWDDYHGNYRWHKLTAAVRQMGWTVKDAHGALGDCLMTRQVVIAMIAEIAAREIRAQLTEQPASNPAGE